MVLVDGLGHNVNALISPKIYHKPSPAVLFLENITLILFFSCFIFFSVNLPAYLSITGYKINPGRFMKEAPNIENAVVLADNSVPTADPNTTVAVQSGTTAISAPAKTAASATSPKQYADNTLFIPKVGIEAPIGWDTGENGIMSTLEKNLAHIAGTGKPGEGKNIFITGHSSNYWWNRGNYNTIFALLPELKEGDEIFITYQGKFRKYVVSKTEEVKKSEVENYIDSNQEQLTLMTCVPVGTNLKRLLVFAKPS